MVLPPLYYLTQDSSFIDYRPAIDPSGTRVIFERTPRGGGMTTLPRSSSDISTPTAAPFPVRYGAGIADPARLVPGRRAGAVNVMFNGAASNTGAVSVWVVGSMARTPRQLPGTSGAAYPRWNPRVPVRHREQRHSIVAQTPLQYRLQPRR